jgi:cysteine synthase A
MGFSSILASVGDTPLIQLPFEYNSNVKLYAKLEFLNPTGSVKDRAASYILHECLKNGTINSDTTIIESSSGNFGVALAAYCKLNKLRFICVIDPNITSVNELLLKSFKAEIIKVEEPDMYGGYLLSRIKKVKEIVKETENIYWTDQYNSTLNSQAYYNTLGNEICNHLDKIDYLFAGVSSGGTLTGLSRRIKSGFPESKVIAVDSVGSVIFGGAPKKRYVPGIGSSMRPGILDHAMIDDHILVDESYAVSTCHELLKKHFLFAGGSSGSVIAGIQEYFKNKNLKTAVNVVAVLADKGEKYVSTIYNKQWYEAIWSTELIYNYSERAQPAEVF